MAQINAIRAAADIRKWRLAKMLPKVYGDSAGEAADENRKPIEIKSYIGVSPDDWDAVENKPKKRESV